MRPGRVRRTAAPRAKLTGALRRFAPRRKVRSLDGPAHPRPTPAEAAQAEALFVEALERAPFDAAPGEGRDRRTANEPVRPSAAAVLRDLSRGARRISEDHVVSLRGMTSDRARHCLEGFLRQRQRQRVRYVGVIHGKGLRSPGGVGVLRREVPRWLDAWRPELVEHWRTAERRDGDHGALYVVLRTP